MKKIKSWQVYLNSAIGLSSFGAAWYFYDWKLALILAVMFFTFRVETNILNQQKDRDNGND